MDLRNKRITVGELLDNPRSKAVFQRRFGRFMNHPMVSAARTLSLDQLEEMASVYLPKKTIQETLKELGAGDIPRIVVYNKADLCQPERIPRKCGAQIYLSASLGVGLQELVEMIQEKVAGR